MTEEVYIVSIGRTPVGKAHKGKLSKTRPDDLLAHVIRGVLAQVPGIQPKKISDVIVGCAMPEAEQGLNIARISALIAGLPDSVPGMTINRYCSSGLQSMAIAADQIRSGGADVILAGGVESMSLIPFGGNKLTANPIWYENNQHVAIGYGMGITAEIVAEKFNISREDQDLFALQSHQKAIFAQENNLFNSEIFPIKIISRNLEHRNLEKDLKIKEEVFLLDQDEGPRVDTSLEQLAKLKPVFKKLGSVTAGNSSQVSDGAAMAVLVSGRYLKQHPEIKPLAKFLSYAVQGVPPEIMGIGPVAAIPMALEKANLSLDQIDWIELNEAFAAQAVAVIRSLKLDPNKVNPYGGAIALGHPLGATGCIRAATLLSGMSAKKLKYGMVTMCIGTGMGACGIFERVSF